MYPIQTSLLITLKNRLGAIYSSRSFLLLLLLTYSSAGLVVVCRIASVWLGVI